MRPPFVVIAITTTFILLGNLSAKAEAIISGPTSSSTGNYTLSWDIVCDASNGDWITLHENSTAYSMGCAQSKSFTNKPDGAYIYDLAHCSDLGPWVGRLCLGPGHYDSHTVTVGSGGGTQGGSDNVRIGDFDGDTVGDLFVSPKYGTPFILRRDLMESDFDLIAGLSSQQINTFDNWPTANGVHLNYSDMDVDGVIDVMVNGISNAVSWFPEFAVDQAVVSTSGLPRRTIGLTDDKKQFLREVLGWAVDKRYFVDTAIANGWYDIRYVTETGTWYMINLTEFMWNDEPLTDDPMDESTTPDVCSSASYQCGFDINYGWWVSGSITYSYYDIQWSHFTQAALDLVDAVEYVINSDSGTLDSVLDVLQRVFGTIYCAVDTADVPNWGGGFSDSYYRENHCIFLVLARYAPALFDYGSSLGPDDTRIQLRTRTLFQFWQMDIMHASVHYPPADQWLSAFPTEDQPGPLYNDGGYLKSPDNVMHPSDAYQNTVLYGYVDTVGAPSTKWQEMLTADNRYGDDLTYCLFPSQNRSVIGSCVGYNSNSYAKGIIDKVGGGIDDISGVFGTGSPIDILPGMSKPVPGSEF